MLIISNPVSDLGRPILSFTLFMRIFKSIKYNKFYCIKHFCDKSYKQRDKNLSQNAQRDASMGVGSGSRVPWLPLDFHTWH